MMGAMDSRDVVVVSRPYEPENDVLSLARDLAASTIGLVVYSTQTAFALTEATARSFAGAVLDRVVPPLVDAIVSRVDLTDVVISQVDLRRVVESALAELDLTQIVLDQVDVNRIVDAADIDSIVDRVPMVQIADYVIEEIDLPQIIRESTGGIAMDAFTSTRFSAVRTDDVLSRIVDTVLLRRRPRDLDVDSADVDGADDDSAETR